MLKVELDVDKGIRCGAGGSICPREGLVTWGLSGLIATLGTFTLLVDSSEWIKHFDTASQGQWTCL